MGKTGDALDLTSSKYNNNGCVIQCSHFCEEMVKAKLDIMFSIDFQQCKTEETMVYHKLFTSHLACRLSSLVIYNVYLHRSFIMYFMLCNLATGTSKDSVLYNTSWVSFLLNGRHVPGDKASSVEMCPLCRNCLNLKMTF